VKNGKQTAYKLSSLCLPLQPGYWALSFVGGILCERFGGDEMWPKEESDQEKRNKERHAHACTHIKSVAKNSPQIKYGQKRKWTKVGAGGCESGAVLPIKKI